jgi:hypothetical protein
MKRDGSRLTVPSYQDGLFPASLPPRLGFALFAMNSILPFADLPYELWPDRDVPARAQDEF